jgi:chemotaxis protein methyltransferase CheR
MTVPAKTHEVPGDGRLDISDTEFVQFQELIHRKAGIWLSSDKQPLLIARMWARMRELGLRTFHDYHRRVLEDGEAELVRVLDAITTNETSFFRDPRQFEFLEEKVLPLWATRARSRRVRVWCAGCSTGEEPYSIAMALRHRLPQSAGWDVKILATDLSSRALERARAGIFSLTKRDQVPERYLKKYMLRGHGAHDGKMAVMDEVRAMVQFARHNLIDEIWPLHGAVDLLFCRNVLIYFSRESREEAARRLAARVAPGGYLFLGHAESLRGMGTDLQPTIPAVYTRGERNMGRAQNRADARANG